MNLLPKTSKLNAVLIIQARPNYLACEPEVNLLLPGIILAGTLLSPGELYY